MVNFLKLEGPQGWFAIEITYVTAVIFWTYYRVYELPVRIMYGALVLTYRLCAPVPRVFEGFVGLLPPDLPLLVEANILLCILLALHLYWTYLLLRIGFRLVTESAATVSRRKLKTHFYRQHECALNSDSPCVFVVEYEGDSDVDESKESSGAALSSGSDRNVDAPTS